MHRANLYPHCFTKSLHMAVFPLCLCPNVPLFIRKASYFGLEAHPTPIWPYYNLMISSMTLFPNKVTFWCTGIRTSIQEWGREGQNSTHNVATRKPKIEYAACLIFPLDRAGLGRQSNSDARWPGSWWGMLTHSILTPWGFITWSITRDQAWDS